MLGCPVRNRDWIITDYMEGLLSQDIPKDLIHFAFLLDNSNDSTEYIIRKMTKDCPNVDIFYLSSSNQDFYEREKNQNYSHMATVKNEWLAMRRKKDKYCVMVDSDIILEEEDSVYKLIMTGLPIVSAPVLNLNSNTPHYNILEKIDKGFRHYYTPELLPHIETDCGRVIEVDSTGACIAIRRDVADRVSYTYHKSGEDQGFSILAKEMGYKLYCNLDIKTTHVRNRGRWLSHGEGLHANIH